MLAITSLHFKWPYIPNSMPMKDFDRLESFFFNLCVEALEMVREECTEFKTWLHWDPCVGDPKIRENTGKHFSYL